MAWARLCLLASAIGSSATSLPWRSTATRSATAMTSFSLWEMKMIESPSATMAFKVLKRVSTSLGASTAVGSSRMRTRAPR